MLGMRCATDELDQSKEDMRKEVSLHKLHAVNPELASCTEPLLREDFASTGSGSGTPCDVLDSQGPGG